MKYHVSNLLEATGARTRAELVSLAYRSGLMDAPSRTAAQHPERARRSLSQVQSADSPSDSLSAGPAQRTGRAPRRWPLGVRPAPTRSRDATQRPDGHANSLREGSATHGLQSRPSAGREPGGSRTRVGGRDRDVAKSTDLHVPIPACRVPLQRSRERLGDVRWREAADEGRGRQGHQGQDGKSRITMEQRKASAALHAARARLSIPSAPGKVGVRRHGKVSAWRCPSRGDAELLRARIATGLNSPMHPQVRRLAAGPGRRQARTTSGSTSRSPSRTRRPTRAPTTTRSRSASTPRRCTRPARRSCAATGRPTWAAPRTTTWARCIIADKDRPVRIKFTNNLPTGAGGNLFLPVDTTVMGAGMGRWDQRRRATRWTTRRTAPPSTCTAATPRGSATARRTSGPRRPARTTDYPKGVSVQNVPDMPDPGPRVDDVLLHQPAERPADVLPRPRLRHHPPERLRRRGGGLPDDRRGRDRT